MCPGLPTQRRDFDYLRPLQTFLRVWPIGWASDRQSDQRSSILRTRSTPARVAQVEEHRIRNAEVGVSNIPSGSSRCSSMEEQLHGRQPTSVRFAPLAPEFQAL